MFWTEYLMRHGGAPHLRSPAKPLPLAIFFNLDVAAFVTAAAAIALWIAWKTSLRLAARGLRTVIS